MKTLTKTLALSSAFSILLVFIRVEWSGSIHYIFLPWNLFLAWIPFLSAFLLNEARQQNYPKYIVAACFFSWLIFFPNSPYILTDLFHLRPKNGIPLWFDLILILSFAWNGLILGFASLFEIKRFLREKFSGTLVKLFIAVLMIMCSFGIYLGRYPRWNSWDIITNPIALFGDIFQMILHPLDNTRMVGVTFFFSVFLILSYGTLNALIRTIKREPHEQ